MVQRHDDVSMRHVSLTLLTGAVQHTANLEAAAGEEEESHKDALLARGPATTMEPDHERVL